MLELKNISLSVEDEFSNNTQKEILRDISFTVDSGKFVVITGPNGGGKSTMASLLMGRKIHPGKNHCRNSSAGKGTDFARR